MSDKPTYSIVRWDDSFENHESRKIRRLGWVPMPNKHDGKGIKRISRDPRAVEVFCAWCLMVEVASRMPERGVLADDDGPLDAQDLADKTNYSPVIFEVAFAVLTRPDIGWLASTGEHPGTPGKAGVTPGDAGTEGKGTEGNRREGNVNGLRPASAGLPPPPFAGVEFLKEWEDYCLHRKQMKKPLTKIACSRLFLQFQKMGEPRATAALTYSMADGRTWQGVFEDVKRAAPTPQQPMFDNGPKGDPNCTRCNGTQTEIVPGKGARFCDCQPLTEDNQ